MDFKKERKLVLTRGGKGEGWKGERGKREAESEIQAVDSYAFNPVLCGTQNKFCFHMFALGRKLVLWMLLGGSL